MDYVYHLEEIDNSKVAQVGGKNASLGEMFQNLKEAGLNVPDGFATTADAFRDFLKYNDLEDKLRDKLGEVDQDEYSNLDEISQQLKKMVMEAEMPEPLDRAVRKAYEQLQERAQDMESVAIRSSATAEDLPEASFAGQHDSFLNISGADEVVHNVQKCMASLFNGRAIKYREDNGFKHMDVALSAGVQRMVRADKASAGVAFTIEPDTGFEPVIFINGSWGLGDNVVGGIVNADEYYLYKPNIDNGYDPLIMKNLGTKKQTLVYAEKGASDEEGQPTVNEDTPEEKQRQFVLSDEEARQLGVWCKRIEQHYDQAMDIEWAKDGKSEKIYIVQARPETVHSAQEGSSLKHYSLKSSGEVLLSGSSIGRSIASGKVKILHSPEESDKLEEGDVLVTERTNPDWDPIMRKAGAIITDSGGRTSHAAIVARELKATVIVGAAGATSKLEDGQVVTVSCAEGQTGKVYDGELEWKEEAIDMEELGEPETEVMLILANPLQAFQYAGYPVKGVGLARLEFVINNTIQVHPMALVDFDKVEDKETREKIERLTDAYDNKEDYFREKLAMAVGTIAAAFHPHDVIVRMSDFKTNEYADLIGGENFEPEEANPMLGFRGASRYYSDQYREGFRLECEAMRIAREKMGFENIKLMIPFCRTPEEGRRVIKEMEKHGLKQGEKGLEIYVMAEIPSNVIGGEAFAEIFDGFSIGSNDLTQLTLGVDRDSDIISELFEEQNDQVKRMIAMVIKKAKEADRKIGLCGQAPSDFPEFAQFLVEEGIHSISFNPDAVVQGIKNIVEAEQKQ
jgi:pyruvate, water dikinase